MCALALLAIAAAPPAPRPAGEQDRSDRQPDAWRDTGILPASVDEQPPPDPGMVKVSVPEALSGTKI